MENKILITVTGKDREGIVAAVTGVIAEAELPIYDIAQRVHYGIIVLTLLIDVSSCSEKEIDFQALPFVDRLMNLAGQLEIRIDCSPFPRSEAIKKKRQETFVITCLGRDISGRFISELSAVLAANHLNIERIKPLTEGGLHCLEMAAATQTKLDLVNLNKQLMSMGKPHEIDIAVQHDNIYRKSKRLIVFDMDSTLIQGEMIDELAKLAGVEREVKEITRAAMTGSVDFQESLRKRVRLLKGLEQENLERAYRAIPLMPGLDKLFIILKKLGYKTAVISGGFKFFVEHFQREYQVDYSFANGLEINNGVVTGNLTGEIIDATAKADKMEIVAAQENISLYQVIAVGDGANDIEMLSRAGLGIAFNAKPVVQKAAGYRISQRRLDSILFLLGITEKDMQDIHTTV
ncbi:MAG: phosphoserine phosphatase SerB [bacterium]